MRTVLLAQSVALIVVALFGATSPAVAQDANVQAGEELYKVCAVCHGKKALGNPTLNAPKLVDQSTAYLQRQLQNFKSGLRGKAKGDRYGGQMQPMVSALDEADIINVAGYIASLTPPVAKKVKSKVKGDAEKGRQLYQTCVACHGADGKGNDALGAPRLAGQSDWYLLRQLQNFQKGARGAQPGDTFGSQMRAMATTLADKKSQRNVVAYINSLGAEAN